MLQYDFEQSVGYWVTVTSLAFHRLLNEELAPHGITFRQSQVLGWLALKGPLSQSQLACYMQVEAPTLAGLIDRMERAGWIRREACPDDRRKKLVVTNCEAEPIWEQIADCARRVRSVATKGLSEEQIETLRGQLKQVHENLLDALSSRELSSEPTCRPSTDDRHGERT